MLGGGGGGVAAPGLAARPRPLGGEGAVPHIGVVVGPGSCDMRPESAPAGVFFLSCLHVCDLGPKDIGYQHGTVHQFGQRVPWPKASPTTSQSLSPAFSAVGPPPLVRPVPSGAPTICRCGASTVGRVLWPAYLRFLAIKRRWSSPSRIPLAFQQYVEYHAGEPRHTDRPRKYPYPEYPSIQQATEKWEKWGK